jgi:hypothetical protein
VEKPTEPRQRETLVTEVNRHVGDLDIDPSSKDFHKVVNYESVSEDEPDRVDEIWLSTVRDALRNQMTQIGSRK